MPKNVENTTTCRMSPRAIASMTEVGKQVQEDVPGVLLVLRHRRHRRGVAADRHREPGAGLEHVDERQPEKQRDRRRDLEVDDRLQRRSAPSP